MMSFWHPMSGFGQILHILCRNGANPRTSSMFRIHHYMFLTCICRPEKSTAENTKYNYHLSAVRIRSEHCVGFLKGRWSSLRGLRISIDNDKGVKYASLWIMACINLHAFAIRHENGNELSTDNFYRAGRKYVKKQRKIERRWRRRRRRENAEAEQERERNDDEDLLEGRIMREELKEKLFEYLGDVEME